MSRPAARVGDPHICPSVDPAPHIGGPVLPAGFARVQIEAKSSARAGDLVSCMGGRRDASVEGSGTVLIGGRPAARLHEKTGHGGRVMGGAWTARIGGPTVSPPGVQDTVKKLEEVDRLRREIERRKRRIAIIDENLRPMTPQEELLEAIRKLAEPRSDPNLPGGVDAEAERQGKEFAERAQKAERERLKLENTVDERKAKKLEEEIQKQAEAPPPPPPPPPPKPGPAV